MIKALLKHLAPKKIVHSARKVEAKPIIVDPSEGGFVKFGTIPAGGSNAGSPLSRDNGISEDDTPEAISFARKGKARRNVWRASLTIRVLEEIGNGR